MWLLCIAVQAKLAWAEVPITVDLGEFLLKLKRFSTTHN